jgi:hypothetical protein
MFLSKVKLVVVVLLALGVVGSGAGFVAHRTVAGQPAAKPDRASVLPGGAAAKANEKAIEEEPEEAAPVPPGKPKQDGPEAGAKPDATARIRKWRELLNHPIDFEGIDDPKVTLGEMLKNLRDRYGVTFEINERAFAEQDVADVGRFPLTAEKPIPPLPKASLATVLRVILSRIPLGSKPVYVLRADTVEITTKEALQDELGIPRNLIRSVLPLVWDVFEDTPISKALASVTETTGYNVVVDSRVADKVQTRATVQFNNVPVDTAVRLLANMADLSMVRLDNVFYLTTAENAKRLHEEQVRLNYTVPGDELLANPAAKQPAK